ncbi:MAG: hypothetical protein M3Q34_01630 [bacterium]|nr:hypothetical protein [bacterium]
MRKLLKIIGILALVCIIFFVVIQVILVKWLSDVEEQKKQIVEKQKVIAARELEQRGEAASDPSLHITPATSWQTYSYPDAGFAVSFPNQPYVDIKQKPQYFEEESSFKAGLYVPGEMISYSIFYYKDKGMTLESLKTLYKIIFGDAIEFSSTTIGRFYGNEIATYTWTRPKKGFGKVTVIGDRAYFIHAECLYCTEVPEFDNFINSFRLINN